MSCVTSDFFIDNDDKGKVKKAIVEKVSSVVERYTIAAKVNNGSFHKWAYENVLTYKESYDKKQSTADVDGNVLKSAIRQYQQYLFPTIKNFANASTGRSLDNFTNSNAKQIAIKHTGNLIREKYLNQFRLPPEQRIGYDRILVEITKDIIKDFSIRTKAFINTIYDKNFEEVNRINELIQRQEEIKKESKSILEEVSDIDNKLNSNDTSINKKELGLRRRELAVKHKSLKEENINLDERIFALEEVIIDKYNKPEYNTGWEQLDNFTALYNKVKINSGDNSRRTWFEEALTTSNMLQFAKELKQSLESDKLTAINSEDISTLENDNSENIDESTKNWEDVLASNYNNMYSTKMKMELDNLYDLRVPVSVNDKYEEVVSYNIDNELGVRTNRGYKFYIQQLQTLGNYSSPEALMESIRVKAYNVPELYALSILYRKMLKDVEFRNYIFKELKTPLIKKAIIELQGNSVRFAWNNQDAFNGNNFYFTLYHQLKQTYKDNFNKTIYSKVRTYIDLLNKKQIADNFNNNAIREEIYNFIVDYFKKYFPNIENSTINEWLFNKNNTTINTFKDILNAISSLELGLERFIIAQNNSDAKVTEERKKWYKQRDAANEMLAAGMIPNKLPDIPQYTFETEVYNNNVAVALQNITQLIVDNIVSKVDLNHANGENKLASDLINNNYITNILEMIKTGAVDTQVGLKQLFKRVSQSSQYIANPIFFGVKDRNGNYKVHGLFDVQGEIRPDATFTINPKATEILDFILFDGIKNVDTNTGTVYTRMGKSDYFITNLIAFTQEFNRRKGIGGLFTRIPSDAGKTFICETIKYDTSDLYQVNNLTQFKDKLVNSYIEKYKDLINFKEENTILKELKAYPSNYRKNIISFNRALEILNNNGEQQIDISGLKHAKIEKTTEVLIPLVIRKEGKNKKGEMTNINSFTIILKGNVNTDNIIINPTIYSINSLVKTDVIDLTKDYTSAADELTQFINSPANENNIKDYGIKTGQINYSINSTNTVYLVLYNQVISEIREFVNQLNNVLVWDGRRKTYITKTDTKGLYDVAHYNKSIVKNGELTGGFFKFKKLFNTNGKDYSRRIMDAISLYGGSPNSLLQSITSNKIEGLRLNLDRLKDNNDFITVNRNNDRPLSFQETPQLREQIDNILKEWIVDFIQETTNVHNQYKIILDNTDIGYIGSRDNTISLAINSVITNMCFDDILEGSTSFYKDAQTFLKRAKEMQMSGKAFASNVLEDPFGPIKSNNINSYELTSTREVYSNKVEEILVKQRVETKDADGNISISYQLRPYNIPRRENGALTVATLTARNGFRAIAIKNTIKSYDRAKDLRKQVYEETLKKVNDEEIAKTVADNIAKGYIASTVVNDAQSYITLDEFIRRRYLDGTLNEYQDILAQLLDDKVEVKDMDLKAINAKIQVQKNIYYDINFDNKNNVYVPRQIKNAEFVLIPKLLPDIIHEDGTREPSDLKKLALLMQKYDINQINTEETLKAGKKNVLTLWDNYGVADFTAFEKELQNEDNVENYYYQYLYKQQDVVDHMQDERNKFGIQIAKKIQDNASTSSKKVQDAVDTLQRNYVANIKSSFDKLIFNLGFTTDEKGVICNRYYRTTDTDGNPLTAEEIQRNKYTLDFKEFYKRARTEAQRLGMDNNFMDYLTPNALGVPEMPNWYNVSSMKLESIAQSIFNSMIARQTLPGWHAAQITNVGYSRKLQYHPDVVDNKGNVVHQGYMEVLLPRWSKLLPQRPEDGSMSQEEWNAQLLKQLESEGLDLHIGYRIPTEGKQSVSVLKVVGFLDEAYGSTIVVSDQWVTQTGSDFDVDTVYGISFEFYRDRNGKFKAIRSDLDETEDGYRRRYITYINDLIKERQRVDNNYQYANPIIKEQLNKYKEIHKVVNTKRPYAKVYKQIVEIRDKEENKNIKQKLLSYNTYAKNHNLTEQENYENIIINISNLEDNTLYIDQWEDLKKLRELYSILVDQYRQEENNNVNDAYSELTFKELKELQAQVREDYFNTIQDIAKGLRLISYEDFKKLPLEEQQNEKARNNAIVQAMIDIMSDSTTLEENLSRSNFDDIGDAKKDLEKIDSNLSFNSMSPYNPFTQLQFFENAINGRKLKAFSVDRDTFTSLSNKVHTVLTKGNEIVVEYDAYKYNRDLLVKNGYYVENVTKNGKLYYRVAHNMFGWSKTNRNVVGKLITAYSSQTTAHILDAIKMGALYNETDFTFGTFKTLIDVGIDYETAVMFLAQPGVTLINNYNFQKQSVYVNNNINPIDSAIKDIASKLGIVVNNKSVDLYSKTDDVLKALMSNADFVSAMQSNFEGSNLKDFSKGDINIILNRDSLIERLKQGQSTQSYTKSNGELDYDKAAFDIGIILGFKKFYNTTKTLEKLSRLSNPDSFGARQTIHETRLKLDDINEVLEDVEKENPNLDVNKIISTEDGVGVLESIYTDNIYESKYPYLAAMLRYATESSVSINSKIFRFEYPDIQNYITQVQGKLGIVFNQEQYEDFKNYIVSCVFNSIELLNTPVTVNKSGFITPNADNIRREGKFDYWNDEAGRIYGYKEYLNKFEVKDILNPTEEEINNFIQLTPLQKVIWIQQNFDITGSIFEILKTYKYSGRTVNNNSYTNNVIRYNDTVYNSEEVLNKFEQAFFSSNPLIKLTAIDLIKYAFIVEGFNFKKGSTSKIIKNNTIKQLINQKGYNIVNTSIDILENKLDLFQDTFTERFVRSHPEVVKEIRYGKTSNLNKDFNTCQDESGLAFIPLTDNFKELRGSIIVNDKDKAFSYVRITSYSSTGEKVQNLYKIYRVPSAGVYLIPLNLLNRNEVAEYSINSTNNTHYTYEYYQELIENSGEETSILKVRDKKQNKVYYDLLKYRNNYKIPTYNYYETNSEIESPNYLIDTFNGDISNKDKEQLNKFFNDINNNYNYITKDGYILVWNESFILGKVLKDSKGKLFQNISINGKNTYVEITKYNKNLGINAKKNTLWTEQEYKLRNGEKGILNALINHPNIYKITIPKDESSIIEEGENIEEAIREKYENNPSILSGLRSNNFIIGQTNLNTNEFSDIDKVGKYILDDIYFKEIKETGSRQIDFFSKLSSQGINRNSLRSIDENKIIVFKSAAKYYKKLADKLIYEINHFTIEDEEFKLNDDNLYKKLRDNPEDAAKLMKLMLQAKTFGRTIDAIFNLDITGEDVKTTEAIESIKQSINKVKDNTLLQKAFDNIYNIYLVEQYSNNPNYELGVAFATDNWRDANFFEMNISDIRDLNNKQIQIIVKAIGSIIAKSRFDAIENQKQFKKELQKLLNLPGNFKWSDIIDENGRLIRPYVDKFIEDKANIREKVNLAYAKYNDVLRTKDINKIITERINLEKILLERDKWFAKNVEQEVISDYYNKLNTIREKVLEKAPRQFAEYRVLGDIINKNYSDIRSLSEDERKERHNYFLQRTQLTSNIYSNGVEKTGADLEATISLNEYRQQLRELSEQYFEYEPTEDFKKELKENLDIINEIDKQHPQWTLEEKLNNERYFDAYYWLKDNARRTITKDVSKMISDAFTAIKSKQGLSNNNPLNPFKKIYDKLDNYQKYDAFGIINGLAFEKYVEGHPDDDIIQQMHDILVEINNPFSTNRSTEHPDHILSDNNLIKDIPSDLPVFNDAFYAEFRTPDDKNPEVISRRFKLMGEINLIIANAIDPDTGHISSQRLFDNLTEDEIKHLIDLYAELKDINKGLFDNLENASKNNIIVRKTNNVQFNIEKAWFDANAKTNARKRLWLQIFVETDSAGNIKLDDNGNYIPNHYIYGYYEPIAKYYDKYVDKKKTDARRFIRDNISYTETPYYRIAIEEHTKKGDYNEWYNKNHYYNPYTHRIEPIRIWTTMEINPNLGKNGTYEWSPTFNNTKRNIKETKYINKKYNKYSTNYNTTTGEYTNAKYNILNDKAKQIAEFVQNTLNQTASSNDMRQWFEQGYMPRKYRPNIDASWVAKNVFGAVGLEIGNYRNVEWHDHISYEKDFEADFDMTRILRAKGYEEYKKPEKQQEEQTDNEYKLYLQQIDKENAEIRKRNLEREKAIRDENWADVLEEYIGRITEYKARTKVKDLTYLEIEDLKSRQSYRTTPFGKLSRRRNSPVEEEWYNTIPQTRTLKIFENWARRILFQEFKQPNPTREYADLLQNITSAKYMIFNVTGGISNVTTGLVNMMGEAFAGQFFNMKEFRAAQGKYFANAIGCIASMWSENSPNIAVGLTKRYNVVDFDAMVERKPGESAAEWAERSRNLLYGLQSGGEHYMQNTILFACLKSHRIFTDAYGKKVIGNFNDYTINIDYTALKNVIKDNPEFIAKLDMMKKDIRRNKDLQKEYDLFQRDFCQDFIASIVDRKVRNDLAKKYIAERKELLKNAKVEFEKCPTVENQYEFKDGMAVIKKDSELTTEMEGQLKDRIQTINTQIHGVYDKIGAARIESEWWGGLVMQYHKHIYPGIMKRYRKQGYFNEIRGVVNQGSYYSLWNLLTKDFNGISKRIQELHNDGTNIAIASLREIAKSAINCIINIQFNYSTSPIWMQQNMRKVLGDLLGITSAILAALAIYALTDDDDREDSDLINTCIYLSDRLFSESQMYTPWGLPAEASTMWSSPIAAQNGPTDLLKGLNYIGQYIFNDDFEPEYQTGLYAGQNKLAVIVKRNIPFWRVINRLDNMSRNNSYYRINENSFNIGVAESIAAKLKGEE